MFVSRHSSRDDTLARDVLGFKHLRTLVIDTTQCCNLSHHDLGLLFSTLKLEHIALWLSSWDVRDPGPLYAPHLRSLELRGPVVELATAVSCLHGSNLQCIALEVQGGLPIRLQGMHTMLAGVSTSPISNSLTHLEIYVYNMAPAGIDETLLLSKVLHPCFSMRQLQYLSFTYDRWRDGAVVCTDEDILAIATSLGSLRHLKLHVTSPLSPLSLVHLARHCRKLAEVYLWAVSVEDVTTLPLLAQDFPHPLRTLFLREGPLLAAIDSSDPSESLTEFLGGLFPNVVVTPWPRLSAEDMWQRLGITSGWNHPYNDGDMYCNMSPGDCQILGARV
ncbi:hypothetical protein C8Q74DRAFT_1279757 [Fomes fomentarius]|nr:hypothetical protein C8Q74DRAFT_1279757 [Fomes fomentarius]